uniref:Uncharacterized protein n=1 Tax=Rhizophora mucronata TaxID=61149 RepID=A0A2P2KUA0_RHIMU
MASTSAVAACISNLNGVGDRRKPLPSSFPPGNLNMNPNIVGKQFLSWPSHQISEHGDRTVRVSGLFGGKKENSEKGDDTPSKVNHTNLFITVNMNVVDWMYFLVIKVA